MTPMQALVYQTILRAGRHGVPLSRLVDVMNNHRAARRLDPPDDPQLIARVTINQIKHQGNAIPDGRSGDRRYRLEAPCAQTNSKSSDRCDETGDPIGKSPTG